MSAFDRLLSLVAEVFTLNSSIDRRLMSDGFTEDLRGKILTANNTIYAINELIEVIITEIGNNQLSAEDINILYVIEQLSEQLRILIQRRDPNNYNDGSGRQTGLIICRTRTLDVTDLLNGFIAGCKRRTNLSLDTPHDIQAAAAVRANQAIVESERQHIGDIFETDRIYQLRRDRDAQVARYRAYQQERQAAYIQGQVEQGRLPSAAGASADRPPLSDARLRLRSLNAQWSRDDYRRRQDREEEARLRAAAPAAAVNPLAEPFNNPVRILHRPQSPNYPPPDLNPRPPTPPRPPYRLAEPFNESAPLNPRVFFPEPLPDAAREQPPRNEAERGNFNIMANQHPNPPNELVCPITQEIMFDPVVASDGRTYERNAIYTWLSTKNTSPMTKEPIDKTLRTNWAIRSAIQRFVEGSFVKDIVGNSVDMLMKKINDGKAEDKKINKKDALVLLYENDFNVDKAFQAYMMTQGGRKGGTRRNLRKKPRNQRKNKTKKRK
jgi:hypothetical protein